MSYIKADDNFVVVIQWLQNFQMYRDYIPVIIVGECKETFDAYKTSKCLPYFLLTLFQ